MFRTSSEKCRTISATSPETNLDFFRTIWTMFRNNSAFFGKSSRTFLDIFQNVSGTNPNIFQTIRLFVRKLYMNENIWMNEDTPYSMNSLFSEFFKNIGGIFLEVCETISGGSWEVFGGQIEENYPEINRTKSEKSY